MQNVNKASMLSPNMTKTEASNIMGLRAKSEFTGIIEEWHYCRTGLQADELVALYFHDGLLVGTKNYTVTLQDTGGVTGDCSVFIKQGNYQEPDSIQEIRVR